MKFSAIFWLKLINNNLEYFKNIMSSPPNSLPRLEFSKIIRDCIHGYIQLTETEFELIQLPALNRLHYIKQNSTAYLVFPCAKSTRFEHSLGVMHIASKMINQILLSTSPEILQDLFGLKVGKKSFEEDSCKLIQKIRLAALLHDIGHGPFSHASEKILLNAINDAEKKEACELFACHENKIPSHEFFSYKMITDQNSEIGKIIKKYTKIKPVEVASLLVKAESDESNRILKKIISSQLDSDRMDYLLRDADSTGVVFGKTDIDRVLMNIQIRKDNQNMYEIAVDERALATIEDILDSRFKMHKWVYNHHLVVAFNKLLEIALESLIEKEEMNYEDFHWKKFLEGGTDDNTVYNKINNSKEKQFKGLIDRRYSPVSLLKRPVDYYRLIEMISNEMGRTLPESLIKDKIIKFFNEFQKRTIEVILPKSLPQYFKKMELMTVQMPRSPYKALNGKESVWICNKINDKLEELTTQSQYLDAINREWQSFPSFYLSYWIPGIKKNKIKKHKEKIFQAIARKIASV